ncbi:MAG TPA: Fe-S cluster assembly protein SufD [Devosiaceae bacterium]
MSIHTPTRLGPAEEALAAQLDGGANPQAAARFRDVGLPTRRVEAYHYTDLKSLIRAVPDLASPAITASQSAVNLPGSYRLMIANGRVSEGAGVAPAGVIFRKVDGPVLGERDDAIVRLNAALAREALRLDLDGSVDPLIHIDHRIEGDAAHVVDGAVINVADNASAIVVETFSGSNKAHMGNHAAYVSLGRNARLTHVQIDLGGAEATHFASTEYDIAEGAHLRTLVVHAGSALARSQAFARFAGPGAHADFGGLNLASGNQHLDMTLSIEHAVPGTTSEERIKQVARDGARSVFQGKIVVARDAQKTDARMMSQGLMLSERAEIFSKPELEIFADDVQCGHGSTCGEIDDESLFYLMSRGIPRGEAEGMLVRAFLAELVDGIDNEYLQQAINDIIDRWLGAGAASVAA